MKRLGLEGRRVLVTGGSRGIGRATVRLLGEAGARVAVHYAREAAAAQAAVNEAVAAGGAAEAFGADLQRPEACAALVEQVLQRFGGLDGLVVNHGVWEPAPIETLAAATWERTLDLNLGAAFAIAAPVARHMRERGSGAIVLVASTAGQRGEAGYSPYAASKAGLIALTKSLASELAPAVRVNAVAPGWVMTDMSRDALLGPDGPAALRKIPMGRAGEAEELAGPIAFLLSDFASYLYGEVLCANGGAVMASG
jgi:3-oxoacyl-[acyl-carrier protein] reductase